MAKQTQTKKLRNVLKGRYIYFASDIAQLNKDADISGDFKKLYQRESEFLDQILQACKEAGLAFTDYSTDDEGNIIIQGIEEIEI